MEKRFEGKGITLAKGGFPKVLSHGSEGHKVGD